MLAVMNVDIGSLIEFEATGSNIQCIIAVSFCNRVMSSARIDKNARRNQRRAFRIPVMFIRSVEFRTPSARRWVVHKPLELPELAVSVLSLCDSTPLLHTAGRYGISGPAR
jgi:hypothetical protein